MVAQVLTLALEWVFPTLGAIAVSIAGALTYYNLVNDIKAQLESYPGSTPTQKRTILETLRIQFDQAFNNAAVISELSFYGVDAQMVRSVLRDAIDVELQKLGQLYTFPAFTTVEQAQSWYANVLQNSFEGLVGYDYVIQAGNWVNSEIARITLQPLPVTPAPTPPAPIAITSFPSFATIQEAQVWFGDILNLSLQGLISEESLTAAGNWVNAEIARLTLAGQIAVGGVVAPGAGAVTGAQTVVIPGFGTAQVTVSVQGQTITGMAPAVPVVQPTVQPIVVSAPDVTTGPTTVNVEAPPAPNVWVTPQLSIGAMESLLQALPMTMSQSLVGALAASAGNISHAAGLGRLNCMGTTGGALLQALGLGAAGLALPIAFSKFGPFKQVEAGAFDWLLRQWIDPIKSQGEVKPEAAPEMATAMLNATVVMAVSAHMAAIAAEASTPLKHMGMGYLAGFLGELAGWGRIASGTVGVLESVAISQPMRYYVNDLTRSALPDVSRALSLYASRELAWNGDSNEPGARQVLGYHGLADKWIDMLQDDAWTYPRIREVLRNVQYANPAFIPGMSSPPADVAAYLAGAGVDTGGLAPGDWVFYLAAYKAGYHPALIDWIIAASKQGMARTEKTSYISLATQMRRDGFITADQLRDNIEKAWRFTDPIQASLDLAELQHDYHVTKDTLAVIILSMNKGLITREEARGLLQGLGIEAPVIELEVLKGTLGMLPGMRIEVSRPEAVLEEAGVEA